MTDLSDAQRSLLAPALAREDRCIFPVTARLKGGAMSNVARSLLKRGLVEEAPAERRGYRVAPRRARQRR